MGLFSWGGKPVKVETLENKHKELDREITKLEKVNKYNGEWDSKIQELKKQKLIIKDEIERMNKHFNGKSYVKDGIESDF